MSTFTPIDEIREAKQRKKTRQAFYTPLSVASLMLQELPLYEGCRVLGSGGMLPPLGALAAG